MVSTATVEDVGISSRLGELSVRTVQSRAGLFALTQDQAQQEISKFARLVLRVGHLLAPPHDLLRFADLLERNWFNTREALRDLTDEAATCLDVPLPLAAALRAEAIDGKLLKRYRGKVPVMVEEPEEVTLSPGGAKALLTSSNGAQDRSASLPPHAGGPVNRLVRHLGHLQYVPNDLEDFADALENAGFDTRESLKDLTDDVATKLEVPLHLAASLRAEATQQRLLKRYRGPVPLPDAIPFGDPVPRQSRSQSPNPSRSGPAGAHLPWSSPRTQMRRIPEQTRPRPSAMDIVNGVPLRYPADAERHRQCQQQQQQQQHQPVQQQQLFQQQQPQHQEQLTQAAPTSPQGMSRSPTSLRSLPRAGPQVMAAARAFELANATTNATTNEDQRGNASRGNSSTAPSSPPGMQLAATAPVTEQTLQPVARPLSPLQVSHRSTVLESSRTPTAVTSPASPRLHAAPLRPLSAALAPGITPSYGSAQSCTVGGSHPGSHQPPFQCHGANLVGTGHNTDMKTAFGGDWGYARTSPMPVVSGIPVMQSISRPSEFQTTARVNHVVAMAPQRPGNVLIGQLLPIGMNPCKAHGW